LRESEKKNENPDGSALNEVSRIIPRIKIVESSGSEGIKIRDFSLSNGQKICFKIPILWRIFISLIEREGSLISTPSMSVP